MACRFQFAGLPRPVSQHHNAVCWFLSGLDAERLCRALQHAVIARAAARQYCSLLPVDGATELMTLALLCRLPNRGWHPAEGSDMGLASELASPQLHVQLSLALHSEA